MAVAPSTGAGLTEAALSEPLASSVDGLGVWAPAPSRDPEPEPCPGEAWTSSSPDCATSVAWPLAVVRSRICTGAGTSP